MQSPEHDEPRRAPPPDDRASEAGEYERESVERFEFESRERAAAAMDPELSELVDAGESEDEVAAIVRLGKPDLVPEGVRIIAQFGDIVTVRMQRGAVIPVRESAECASLKTAGAPLGPDLELIAESSEVPEPDTPNDQRRPGGEPATGRGIIVGIVDWGFDFAHPDFRTREGGSRILALWDQRGKASRNSPQPYGYGRIHSRDEIERALAAVDPYAALGYHPGTADTGCGAHGTHVASIAAGNGQSGGPLGIAPEAELVLVHLATWGGRQAKKLGDSVTLLEAIDFIARTAGDRPWVINLSMGRHGEQHDGTTLVEQGLDAALRATPGRAICQSAGNYFQRRIHASGHLRPGENQTLLWRISEADVTPNELEIWYSWRDRLAIEVRSPGGDSLARARLGERVPLVAGGREIGRLYHRPREPNTLDNHVALFLYKGAAPGDWEVTVTGEDVIDGRFHAWIERDAGCPKCQSSFVRDHTSSTTGTICNGMRTIAVGAYNAHEPEEPIAPFSSAGPTRDGRVKPDLCAPGVAVLGARSAPKTGDAGGQLLTRMSGTSMAAPHVTGTVALMFQAAPRRLRIEETHNLLLTSARKVFTDQTERVGSGYLDIQAAVEAARNLRGIGVGSRPIATMEESSMETENETTSKSHVLCPECAARRVAQSDAESEPMSVIDGVEGETEETSHEPVETTFADSEGMESEYDAESRKRRRRTASPFQVQVPLTGGAPALAVPVGGYGSPLAFTVPLGGTPPAPAPPAPPPPAPVQPAPPSQPPASVPATTEPPASGASPDLPLYAPPEEPEEWQQLDTSPGSSPEWPVPREAELPEDFEAETEPAEFFASFEGPPAFGEQVLTAAEAIVERGCDAPQSSAALLEMFLGDGSVAESDGEGAAMSRRLLGRRWPGPTATTLFNAFVYPNHPLRSANALPLHYARRFQLLARPGQALPVLDPRPGDLLLRVAQGEGWVYLAVVSSRDLHRHDRLGYAGLRGEGHPALQPGFYLRVVEVFPRRRQAEGFARRVSDDAGRILPDTLLLRPLPLDYSPSAAASADTFEESISLDDVATEMNGLRCRFLSEHQATRADGTARRFSANALLPIEDWKGAGAEATVAGFDVPKLVLEPAPESVSGMRRYDVGLDAQRVAVVRNARELATWVAREGEFRTNHGAWERERARLSGLLARRQETYSRMWVKQMMYNRFDVTIALWVSRYNTQLNPTAALDANIVKSMLYQESRMGTSGAHLMPPPSDWSSSDRHPIRSRFNIGQAIDSFGPQQWLMMREMANAIFTRHGLGAFDRTWLSKSNKDYAAHAPFMSALREFFEFRDSSNRNLMGTTGRDLHEDYSFWIRTAIRWLFVKYSNLRSPTWAEAVRAYNGGGARAEAYRKAVMARVGTSNPFTAESEPNEIAEEADLAAAWAPARGLSQNGTEYLEASPPAVLPPARTTTVARAGFAPDISVLCPPGPVILDNFALGGDGPTPAHRTRIGTLAQEIVDSQTSSDPIHTLCILGHTDSVGEETPNQDLGARRAIAVANLLEPALETRRPGLAATLGRTVESRGEEAPLAPNDSAANRARNRRVEIFLNRRWIRSTPAVGACPTLAVAPDDPTSPTPFAVGEDTFSATISLFGVSIPVSGTVFYPANAGGSATPFASTLTTRAPVVVFAHGNHSTFRHPTDRFRERCGPGAGFVPLQNHRGYEYLQRLLAGMGMVTVSVDANVTNCAGFSSTNIHQRGALILAAIQHFLNLNASGTSRFVGKLDLTKTALLGHSRGGEAVLVAAETLPTIASLSSARVLGVISLAPTDAGATSGRPNGFAFMTMLPAADGDVIDNDGAKFYDQATPSPFKSQIYVHGANHNFFNRNWPLDEGHGAARLARAEHERILSVYACAFFRGLLLGHNTLRFLRVDVLPPGVPADKVQVSFEATGSTIVDDHENRNISLNALGAPTTQSAGLTAAEFDFQQGVLSSFNNSFFGRTVGMVAQTSAAGGLFRSQLPANINLAGREVWVRAAEVYNGAAVPSLGTGYQIGVEDAAGNTSFADSNDIGGLPRPFDRRADDLARVGRDRTKTMLKTHRFATACFGRPGFDITKIRAVLLRLNRGDNRALAFDQMQIV